MPKVKVTAELEPQTSEIATEKGAVNVHNLSFMLLTACSAYLRKVVRDDITLKSSCSENF
jgi:hypothetical protein